MNFDNQLIIMWLLCISFIGKIFELEERNEELKYIVIRNHTYLAQIIIPEIK